MSKTEAIQHHRAELNARLAGAARAAQGGEWDVVQANIELADIEVRCLKALDNEPPQPQPGWLASLVTGGGK